MFVIILLQLKLFLSQIISYSSFAINYQRTKLQVLEIKFQLYVLKIANFKITHFWCQKKEKFMKSF